MSRRETRTTPKSSVSQKITHQVLDNRPHAISRKALSGTNRKDAAVCEPAHALAGGEPEHAFNVLEDVVESQMVAAVEAIGCTKHAERPIGFDDTNPGTRSNPETLLAIGMRERHPREAGF